MSQEVHHQIVIVGGGTAGITVAARLTKGWFHRRDVAVIEPSDNTSDFRMSSASEIAAVCPRQRLARRSASKHRCWSQTSPRRCRERHSPRNTMATLPVPS